LQERLQQSSLTVHEARDGRHAPQSVEQLTRLSAPAQVLSPQQ
jgi:hypothetical protein